ncbi:hypothetical protein [Rhodococcus sp. NPDC049939]|uniref:hypothetical protein n=1 Tax=Rhodococcus sp. NPDC049939 TaxID=3155511 RepID=UPI0033E6B9F1
MTTDASTEYLSLTEIAEHLDASIEEVRRACSFRKLSLEEDHSSPVVAAKHLDELGRTIAGRRILLERRQRMARGEGGQVIVTLNGIEYRFGPAGAFGLGRKLYAAMFRADFIDRPDAALWDNWTPTPIVKNRLRPRWAVIVKIGDAKHWLDYHDALELYARLRLFVYL